MNSGPWGNRRLTAAASCLSCFVKAANLPFVAADSGDKRGGNVESSALGTGSGQEEEEGTPHAYTHPQSPGNLPGFVFISGVLRDLRIMF